MYSLSIPVSISNPRFETYYESFVEKCRRAGAQRIFLAVSMSVEAEEQKQKEIELLIKYVPRLQELGFEVGVWFSPLGHGYAGATQGSGEDERGLTYTARLEGGVNTSSYCPLDEEFVRLSCDWVQRLGATGISVILLDDDFRYAFKEGTFCCCRHHRALLEEELGEPLDRQRMRKALTEGEPNIWRDIWLKVQGESLRGFAEKLRKALDEVDGSIRLGHCAVLSTWDIDGVDSLTLARTFAGTTKPLMRLIGAPYWASRRAFGQIRLGTVCEYERLQQAWCENSGVEVFCEGDSYPRPRYTVPAAYLEGFDQVMRAAGTSCGILKYMFDYTSSPEFETGYLERHLLDMPLFKIIEKAFEGKKAVGVRVFEPMHTLSLSMNPGDLEERCIPASLRFVTDNSLPVQYDESEAPSIIFGDSAELAEAEHLKHGAVIDAEAAEILMRRGFDVGLISSGASISPAEEEYIKEKETVWVAGGDWQELGISEKAEVLSWLWTAGSKRQAAASYQYENNSGQRFLVYAFRAGTSYETGTQRGVFRGWCRAAQLRNSLPWLSGRHLDAVCAPSPDLYILVKRKENEMTVGLWNFCEDAVLNPGVCLAESWAEVKSHWGSACLEDVSVTLEEIPPFGMACFTLVK